MSNTILENKTKSLLNQSRLGEKTAYKQQHDSKLLFPIPRQYQRETLKLPNTLSFYGNDIWNAYELSWLNPKGKPVVAMAEFSIPCQSPNIVESKSFKLYLNSLNGSMFESVSAVENTLQRDLGKALGCGLGIQLSVLSHVKPYTIKGLTGKCLDDLDITANCYTVDPSLLSTGDKSVSENVYSNLLKSNCLATGQPDWASVQIQYSGKQIDHEGLLKYIISFRDHNEFSEHCVERIFTDILRVCKPKSLTVAAYYTRRGGLDINPWRSTDADKSLTNLRTFRQ